MINKIQQYTKGKIFVLEHDQIKLKIYDEALNLVDSLVPPNKSKFEQKAIIIDYFFAKKAELVGAVASNKRVHF